MIKRTLSWLHQTYMHQAVVQERAATGLSAKCRRSAQVFLNLLATEGVPQDHMHGLNTTAQTSVLVTGASGFIGQHLCRRLLAEGYHVRGVSRRSDPAMPQLTGVEWVTIRDIGPTTDWTDALQGIHYIVHLAALTHQIGKRGEGRAAEFMTVNAAGTRRLAEQSRQSPGLRRFVYVSSINAVTSAADQRVTEDTPPQPDTPYGQSKLAGELALHETLQDRPDWCILRPVLVYGPGNSGNMARLLKLVATGLPLPLAHIHNCRSFIFVDNLVDAILNVLIHPVASRKTFLVSDGQDVSTPELIRMLARQSSLPVRLVPVPVSILKLIGTIGDGLERFLSLYTGLDIYSVEKLVGSLAVDSTAITRDTGWRPPYTLVEGLECTLQTQEM